MLLLTWDRWVERLTQVCGQLVTWLGIVSEDDLPFCLMVASLLVGKMGWLGHITLTIQQSCEAYGGPGAELLYCNFLHILFFMESHEASPNSRGGEILTSPLNGEATKYSGHLCLLSYSFSLKGKWLTGMSFPIVFHCTIYNKIKNSILVMRLFSLYSPCL